MKYVVKNFNSHLPVFSLISFLFLCLLQIQCSKKNEEVGALPLFKPHAPYPSPFEARKVLIGEKYTELSQEGELKVKAGTTLVVTMKANCVSRNKNKTLLSYQLTKNEKNKKTIEKWELFFSSYTLSSPMLYSTIEKSANADACIVGVSPSTTHKISTFNDPAYIPQQKPYLDTIKLEASLNHFSNTNLSPVKVAIIDTGVAVHPDLGNSTEIPGVIYREDMRSGISINALGCEGLTYTNEMPLHHHGTFIAGIIGAKRNNALGVVGIANNAQILSFTVGNCLGFIPTSEIGNALMNALAHEAEVVNLSLGGPVDDLALRQAIITLLNANTVVVAAAGNEFHDLRTHAFYPANYASNYPGMISVAWGTVDGNLFLGNQVDLGANYSPIHVKLLAPGTSIYSTFLPSVTDYSSGMGSSYAAPMVTASAALAIGFLKKHNILYDEQLIDYLITEKGVNKITALEPYVKNGGVLDLLKLGNALQYMVDTGITPQSVTINNAAVSYSTTLNQPVATFTANWNLEVSHFGARLGVFDASCGYSEPCMIHSFDLTGNTGSQSISLTRNELLPMVAAPNDPNFDIFVAVAIYYKIQKPGLAGFYNNYGVDAVGKLNIRTLDMSNASSPFTGEVTQFRTDQMHLYIQGSTCLQGSNKAIPVELFNASGSAITSSYSYFYPYMVGHGSPIDNSSFSQNGGPFVASGMTVYFANQTLYKAGLEANPLLIGNCKTLTASHGFEFILPFDSIKNMNLSGTTVSVRAIDPRNTNNKITLQNSSGQTLFTVPEINYQQNVTRNISFARSTDAIAVSGSLCSTSPSNIHMEVSFSEWNLKCRLLQTTGFPNFLESCPLVTHASSLPLLHDSDYSNRQEFITQYYNYFIPPYGPRSLSTDLGMTATELARHHLKYPALWPNTTLNYYDNTNYLNYIYSKNFKEVTSGDILSQIQYGYTSLNVVGNTPIPILNSFIADRAGSSYEFYYGNYYGKYWDYYDVGEAYTPAVVAYPFNTSKNVGDYLFRTYGISKLLREVKKYETPLGVSSQILDHRILNYSNQDSCGFRFPVTSQVNGIFELHPALEAYIRAYLKVNEPVLQNISLDSIENAMTQIPIDLRFFQDGVMILHLLTNYQTALTPIPTLGRGN